MKYWYTLVWMNIEHTTKLKEASQKRYCMISIQINVLHSLSTLQQMQERKSSCNPGNARCVGRQQKGTSIVAKTRTLSTDSFMWTISSGFYQ